MGLSTVGAVLAKRYNSLPAIFIFSFLAAPLMAFIQKKEADTIYNSEFSKYAQIEIDGTPPLFCSSTPS